MNVFKYTVAQVESQENISYPLDWNNANTRPKINRKWWNNDIHYKLQQKHRLGMVKKKNNAGLNWFYARTISKYNIFHKAKLNV